MIRGKRVTFSAGGSASAPELTVWKLTEGMIYQVEVSFPPGCTGLVSVKISDHAGQLYPYDAGEWFSGDGETISFQETAIVNVPPHELVIAGYNEDEKYDHTVSFRIGFVTKDLYIARFLPSVGAEQIAGVLRQLSAESEARALSERSALLSAGMAALGMATGEREAAP
jgi:hypothetical protein